MSIFFLIPMSIGMGLVALGAFIWALRNGQYDDPEGAAWRPLSGGPPPAPDAPGAPPPDQA